MRRWRLYPGPSRIQDAAAPTVSTTPIPLGRPVRLHADGTEVGTGHLPTLAQARTGFIGRLTRVEIQVSDVQLLDEAAMWEIAANSG